MFGTEIIWQTILRDFFFHTERQDSVLGCEVQKVKSRILCRYLHNHLKYKHFKKVKTILMS